MKSLLILTLAASLSTLPVFAQQTKILTADKHNDYGLLYSLPTTALKISVTAEKQTKTAGPYAAYAKKFIGVSNVINESLTNWTITDVKAVPIGVKGDDTRYLMQLKPGALTYICVDPNGMLLAINDEVNAPERLEIVTTQQTVSSESPGNADDYLKYVDMDFVSAQSSMKQAEMIASSLMDVRDSYLSLTRGTSDSTPTDGRQLELMLSSLKEQEDALTRAFTGTVDKEIIRRDYLYIPEEEGEEILFRLSDFGGFVESDDFSGEPVYIKTEVLLEGQLPLDANGVEKKYPKEAVVYAIPGTARITLMLGNKKLYQTENEFSQFGTVFGLNPLLFSDKKSPSYAIFDSATGALLELGTVSSEQ